MAAVSSNTAAQSEISEHLKNDTCSYDEESSNSEIWWMEQYDFLESRGYRLRPRYRPGWTPSWHTNGKPKYLCEDSAFNLVPHVLDAVRVEDNKPVVIKRVEAGSDEVAICRMLSSPELRKDPHNHAVPVLDYFTKDDDGFLVMPLLRKFDDPPFGTVGEVVDFVRQMLQGINFIHNLNVAHRDCYLGNIMMDATELIPDGFHPQFPSKTLDLSQKVNPLSRSALKVPIRYYFIDFSESSWFRSETSSEDDGKPARQPVDKTLRRLVYGGDCQDPLIPELNSRKPYDPFIFDIGVLGDVFEEAFYWKYSNLEFLYYLANQMNTRKPRRRASEEMALQYLEESVKSMSPAALRWRLKPRREKIVSAVVRDIHSAALEAKYQTLLVVSFITRKSRRGKAKRMLSLSMS